MRHHALQCLPFFTLVASSGLGSWGIAVPALAQIIPDSTLGSEGSRVTPAVETNFGFLDRIDGGAIRANSLFHSFQEFNVNDGQRAYFANPTAIDHIFSRVTGGNASAIFGTLGVLGDANLYLINPSGVFFGPNARLDIEGSFVGSTTNSLVFDHGYTFSAVNPDVPPLLQVNSPIGLASWLPPETGTIVSQGNLNTVQNLTLAGHILELQGRISAGETVTLQATDTLAIRDAATNPSLISAGTVLWLQGNQLLDISALNHPESGLFSGSDLVLRSDRPVNGDAHYFSGGNFRVEGLDGLAGSLVSLQDPVVRASGDVSFGSYEGASLHILAGGSIQADSITITGPDTTGNALQEQVTLSDGETSVAINGNTAPTVDLRAGTLAWGIPGTIPTTPAGFSPSTPGTGGGATGAAITVTTINNPGGLVFLTNQYQPNSALLGEIAVGDIITATDPASGLDGGQVVIDARDGVTFNNIDTSGGDFNAFNLEGGIGGNAGDVTLLAQNDIVMPWRSSIYAYGLTGGAITLNSGTAIVQEAAPFGVSPFDLSWIETDTFDLVQGGDVRLTAPFLFIGGNILASNEGEGTGGNIILDADILETNQSTIATQILGPGAAGRTVVDVGELRLNPYSLIGSYNFSGTGGQGGDVVVEVETTLTASGGGQIASLGFGDGDAGDVTVTAQDISLTGFLSEDLAGGDFFPTSIFSSAQEGSQGDSGNIRVTTGTLSLAAGAAVATTSFGQGDPGDIVIEASESVLVDGAVFLEVANRAEPSAINSEVFTRAEGEGGNIVIKTPVLEVTHGGLITAVSDGDGGAGAITIEASDSVLVDGLAVFSNVGQRDRISQIAVFTAENSTGNGGNLTLIAPSLTLTNNGQLTAETLGVGNAGNIKVDVSDTVLIDGEGSGILSNTADGSTGQGGSLNIDPRRVIVQNGGQVAVNSLGTGQAGNLFIEGGTLLLDRGLISAETVSSAGGDITLRIDDVIVLLNNSRISTTAGTALAGGDGGNIDMRTTYLVADLQGNNDITANAFSGAGGSVLITAEGIFGLTPRSRAELESLLGTSDPVLLDPANLSTSDITAISRGNPSLQGEVTIQTPDTDPNQGAVPLPDGVVDASRLIAQGCASGGAVAQEIGSLVVTGRGGLPPSPTDGSSSSQILLDWASPRADTAGAVAPTTRTPEIANPAVELSSETSSPQPLEEVRSLVRRPDGQVLLVAQATASAPMNPGLPGLTCAGEVPGE